MTGRAAASYATIWPYWLTDNRDVEAVRYDDALLRWAGVDRDEDARAASRRRGAWAS